MRRLTHPTTGIGIRAFDGLLQMRKSKSGRPGREAYRLRSGAHGPDRLDGLAEGVQARCSGFTRRQAGCQLGIDDRVTR